ncbi:MAG: HAD-IA family hydrolase [Planctomycetes bacterium]|nr:HAD-IA family hydrolase [Planctomycetota bacterium]
MTRPESDRAPAFEAICFDAGFTLVEPTRPIAEIYHHFAAEVGVEVDLRDFGRRVASCWTRLNAEFRSADPELRTSEEMERAQWRAFTAEVAAPYPELRERHQDWHELLVGHFDRPEAWRPIAGARETLEALEDRDLVLAVVSNWHGALHGILAAHRLDRHFDLVLTSAEAGRKKPHPEIWREAFRRLDIAPRRCLHLGDSPEDDVLGARAAGLEALLFDPAGRSEETERIACLTDLLDRV